MSFSPKFIDTIQMRRVSFDIRDDCHKTMKLFCAKRDMTVKDFYLAAGRQYLSENSTEAEKKLWPNCFESEECMNDDGIQEEK